MAGLQNLAVDESNVLFNACVVLLNIIVLIQMRHNSHNRLSWRTY